MKNKANGKDQKITVLESPRVVVRFREGFPISDKMSIEDQITRRGLGDWKRFEKKFKGLKISPVFNEKRRRSVAKLIARAQEMDPRYKPADFNSFYFIDAQQGSNLKRMVKELLAWNGVQEAYIDHAGPDPLVDASDDPRAANQGYLDPAPDGIDAEYAWNFLGGDGEGQRFIDLERGWTLDHEDIIDHGASMLHGTLRNGSRSHGTSVLGEICAVDNTIGCVGIVPNIASVDVVSYYGSTRTDAIFEAIDNLNFGDVLLLEAQVYLNGTTLLGPIEAYDAEYEAIRLATALGIIVVEAGGNGTNNGGTPALNMDTYTTLSGLAILNRDPANPDFRDSGAIIVTAASSTAPHTRLSYGPYGRRIDNYAWGQNINTLASSSTGSTTNYTTSFGGTSGASPIITGAALAVQGRAEAQLGFRFSPRQMRAILSNPANGTAPAATETTEISVMPDLRSIFDNVFNLVPDVYLRDFVGDTGEPHSGSISASPDIILRPNPVADPDASFGQGSGTENSNTLGSQAEAGQDNYIYVRVLNQGATAATNVEATVFWAPASTLVTPDLWNLVGSITIPNVPIAEQLTVSDAIIWPSADIPATGHYCFVGLIGNEEDPAPGPADFLDFDNFRRFIRDNNNVTWRNFNVVDNDPDVGDPTIPEGFKALEFLAPGAPDRARPMALEIMAKLPENAKAMLEVPFNFFELLNRRHQLGAIKVDRERRVVYIPVNPHGRIKYGEVIFPAKSRSKIRLLVHIPEKYRKRTFQVAARQLWKKEEVGRVTWLLKPMKKGKQK